MRKLTIISAILFSINSLAATCMVIKKSDPSSSSYDKIVTQIDNAFMNDSLQHFVIIKADDSTITFESPYLIGKDQAELEKIVKEYDGAKIVWFVMGSEGDVSITSGILNAKNLSSKKSIFEENAIASGDFDQKIQIIDVKNQIAFLCYR